MAYPENDDQFQEFKLTKAEPCKGGWEGGDGSLGFFIPDCGTGVVPAVGMLCRMYGKGFGFRFRGIYLDGQKVFYRTEEEDKQHDLEERYGKDAADYLRKWDAGDSVWSIELGGLGPGYEQAIQITGMEVLRHLLAEKYDVAGWLAEPSTWKEDLKKIEAYGFANQIIKDIGLSGAQWGAAVNMATVIYRHGPIKGIHMAPEDRRILVSKTWPKAA